MVILVPLSLLNKHHLVCMAGLRAPETFGYVPNKHHLFLVILEPLRSAEYSLS